MVGINKKLVENLFIIFQLLVFLILDFASNFTAKETKIIRQKLYSQQSQKKRIGCIIL
jgi:hypothetical protein